jgi:hypothetical protein
MPGLRVCIVTLFRLYRNRAAWLCLLLFLLATAVTGSGLLQSLAQSPAQLPGSGPAVGQATAPQATVPLAQGTVSAQPVLQPAVNAEPAGPKQQIAQLLQLATDLKSQVDKTNKDELSVSVVRKASTIEQLAHKVRTAWPAKDH